MPSLCHGEKGCWHQGYWRAPGAGHQTGKKLLGLRTIGLKSGQFKTSVRVNQFKNGTHFSVCRLSPQTMHQFEYLKVVVCPQAVSTPSLMVGVPSLSVAAGCYLLVSEVRRADTICQWPHIPPPPDQPLSSPASYRYGDTV